MKSEEFMSLSPISTEHTVRADEVRALTSCRAGKVVPLFYSPILREDRISRGSINISLKMAETVHPLMNAVNVTAYAHFIPFVAFDRFDGMDSFNRSYQGIGEPHNNTPIPFFGTSTFNRNYAFWKTLGIHWKNGQPINSAPLEAYNLLVNWRRRARSTKLRTRLLDNGFTLASAFWKNPNMYHIVPDFDAAAMDGEVPLSMNIGTIPSSLQLEGITIDGRQSVGLPDVPASDILEFGPEVVSGLGLTGSQAGPNKVGIRKTTEGNGFADPQIHRPDIRAVLPNIFADLQAGGISLSLANIELAKQTASFAKLREQFSALNDDYLIDLLMEGIRIPDEALKQPILLARESTIFGYTERHAMGGANLEKSATTGKTGLTLNFRTPPMNTGGIVLIALEIVPEQLFERQHDYFLSVTNPNDQLPNFMRGFLNPEKVDVVPNKFVDVEHATPDGTFGYAPLNHVWKRSLTRIGGKYYRPLASTFVEDRQRFWLIEKLNPSLTNDFYLVPSKVFRIRCLWIPLPIPLRFFRSARLKSSATPCLARCWRRITATMTRLCRKWIPPVSFSPDRMAGA